MIVLKYIIGLLRKVPIYIWINLFLLVCLFGVNHLRQQAQELADTRQATIVAMEAEAKKVVPQAKEVVTVEVTKYQDRIKYIKGEARVIEKQVPIYIPAGTPDLPAGFRMLHDAAAQGRSLTGDPPGNDGRPVSVEDVALTVGDNYAQCLQDKEKLRFFQALYDKLQIVYGVE